MKPKNERQLLSGWCLKAPTTWEKSLSRCFPSVIWSVASLWTPHKCEKSISTSLARSTFQHMCTYMHSLKMLWCHKGELMPVPGHPPLRPPPCRWFFLRVHFLDWLWNSKNSGMKTMNLTTETIWEGDGKTDLCHSRTTWKGAKAKLCEHAYCETHSGGRQGRCELWDVRHLGHHLILHSPLTKKKIKLFLSTQRLRKREDGKKKKKTAVGKHAAALNSSIKTPSTSLWAQPASSLQ